MLQLGNCQIFFFSYFLQLFDVLILFAKNMASGQVSLEIKTNENTNVTERRFPGTMLIADLKNRLEVITGASAATMKLTFYDLSGNLIAPAEDEKTIESYLLNNSGGKLQLRVKDSNMIGFEDLSMVEKNVMSNEDYENRTDSLRAFKMRNQLGRFAPNVAKLEEEEVDPSIKIGERCEVKVAGAPPRRGQVMYIGKIGNKPGKFVGVKYDEPYGKNDGSFDGVRYDLFDNLFCKNTILLHCRYFQCPSNYGSFVKPSNVQVGDYPEIDVNFDE